MIGPMDCQFPAGISVFALMWAVLHLVCVDKPLSLSVCGAGVRWKAAGMRPFYSAWVEMWCGTQSAP